MGRMLAQAAQKMGYEVHVYSDVPDCPASQVAESTTVASYSDSKSLLKFAEQCDVVTYEFENIPLDSVKAIEKLKPLRPGVAPLETFQNRILEKEFLQKNGIPCSDFAVVNSLEDFRSAIKRINLPSVLKTAGMGYDGKGQTKLTSEDDIEKLENSWQENSYVLEAFVDLKLEFSVVAGRAVDGEFSTWGAIENEHRNHILHISLAPGRVSPEIADQAVQIAKRLGDAIGYVGVFCVEFFLCTDGRLLVNEVAPRVHNSGHLTIEGSVTSQFDQHIRAISEIPLGESSIKVPTAMLNTLGDLWRRGEPDWKSQTEGLRAKVHLYGKKEAKPGRKMGHITILADSIDEAYKSAEKVFSNLGKV